MTRLLEIVALATWLVIAAAGSLAAEDVVVFGAGSLREVMTRLASNFHAARGVTVKTEFGPSGLMRERIERGDKADLLASADVGHPRTLRAQGLADHMSVFARNAVCAAVTPIRRNSAATAGRL